MFMTVLIFISVALGIVSGLTFMPTEMVSNIDQISTVVLGLLLFSVGIDIGSNKGILNNLKEKSTMLFALTVAAIVGSLLGGYIVGLAFDYGTNESLAVSSGFGWYTLSGVLLKGLGSPELGAISFLSNVVREMVAFVFIPILAIKANYFTAIAPAGATAMDTTLPLISKSTSSEFAVIAFLHGAILTTLVPILVPFFYSL